MKIRIPRIDKMKDSCHQRLPAKTQTNPLRLLNDEPEEIHYFQRLYQSLWYRLHLVSHPTEPDRTKYRFHQMKYPNSSIEANLMSD